ncbi:Hsp20/alpha crystallin family protein [Candidatus Poribacteria bacterium]|nr:Hsp20/alpha crystallin family protein [Candidatus Poribacteria bacterium]
MRKSSSDAGKGARSSEGGMGGLFKGLSDLLEKLGDLADKGQELQKTGEFRKAVGANDIKGVYGFSVKVGLGGEGVKVEPFGNIHKDEASGETIVQEVREPIVDVFEEKTHVLVVAEMPGIGTDNLQLDLKDDILTISANREDRKYRKEVLLPGTFTRDKMTVACHNGVVEIRLRK